MTVSMFAFAAGVAAQLAAPPATTTVPWKPIPSAPPASAQVAAQPSAPVAPVATIAPAARQAVILSAPSDGVLRAGTEVALVMQEGIDSNNKTLREGARIRLAVAQPVMLGGMVVIPAGSPAAAEIT